MKFKQESIPSQNLERNNDENPINQDPELGNIIHTEGEIEEAKKRLLELIKNSSLSKPDEIKEEKIEIEEESKKALGEKTADLKAQIDEIIDKESQ